VTIFVGSSIQKQKFSSAFDEVVSFGVSTMTTFFARACTHKSTTLIDVRLAPQAAQKRTFPNRRFVPVSDICAAAI
jgi:hypothetical protein